MFAKTTIFATLALLASVSAQVPAGAEYEGNPNYNFEYSVADPVTGDTKSQSESRQGDVVQGQYSLVEPDGSTRTVNYAADAAGFRAEVSKNGAGAPAQVRKLAYGPTPYVHHHVVPAVVHHHVVPAVVHHPAARIIAPGYPSPYYAPPHVHVAAPYAYPNAYAQPGYAGYPYARY